MMLARVVMYIELEYWLCKNEQYCLSSDGALDLHYNSFYNVYLSGTPMGTVFRRFSMSSTDGMGGRTDFSRGSMVSVRIPILSDHLLPIPRLVYHNQHM